MKSSPAIGLGVAAVGLATARGAYFYSTRKPATAPVSGLGLTMKAAMPAAACASGVAEHWTNQIAEAKRGLQRCGYHVAEIDVMGSGGWVFARI